MNRTKQWIRNPKTLFFLLLLFLTAGISSCKQEKVDLCSQFEEYFIDDTLNITQEDSLVSKNYFEYLKKIITLNGFYFEGDPYAYASIYIAKHIDTGLRSQISNLYYNYPEEYANKIGIDYLLSRYLIFSEAVIFGTVIYKDNYSDSCLFFTTTYHIKVDSIIHSYFPLKKKDIVIIKTNHFGYNGGCFSDKRKKGFSAISHSYDYRLNEQSYFFLDKSMYLNQFFNHILSSKYQDQFCYNSFLLQMNNAELNSLIENCDPKSIIKLTERINK